MLPGTQNNKLKLPTLFSQDFMHLEVVLGFY